MLCITVVRLSLHEVQTLEATMLKVSRLSKGYQLPSGRLSVLREVDLAVARGESVALTGESGSGKSTLLHLIAGLDDADSGEIALDGASISDLPERERAKVRRERLGLVFQQFNLIPSLKIADNLAFQARIAERFDTVWQGELAERLGLAGLLDRYPEQLSGGQQQRVAIGRALASRPALLLADEPTGNLDEATADEVVKLMTDLVARTGCGLLMVTHSLRLASLFDRRVHLTGGRIT
jgi:putative ABC transport system ATP-binding protein